MNMKLNKKRQYLIRYFENDKNIPNSSEFVYNLNIESINHLYDSAK
jgi:P pilus assembly chaperone PapD